MPRDESARDDEFWRVLGRWPPNISLPGKLAMRETEGWRAYHVQKEAGIMGIPDTPWRWERWLEQVQIRQLVNFTERGWAMGSLSPDTHETVLKQFQANMRDGVVKDEGPVNNYIEGDRDMVPLPYKHRVTWELQQLVGEWSGLGAEAIEPTSTYGIRVYYRGSTLETHVDRAETHILSAVYCVDAKYAEGEAEWPMETDPDLTGARASVVVKPGEVFFYESAKLAHGRPSALQGEYSAHVFAHYRPKGWSYTNVDRVYGIPPGWLGDRLKLERAQGPGATEL